MMQKHYFYLYANILLTCLIITHTNFAEVVEGMDVVDKIKAVPTNEADHPTEDVVILDIELIE